jgi:hypothetical protein
MEGGLGISTLLTVLDLGLRSEHARKQLNQPKLLIGIGHPGKSIAQKGKRFLFAGR